MLPGGTLQQSQLLGQAPIVLGRGDPGEYEFFTLLGQSVEIDECPDYRDQQRQTDQAESDKNQAVK